MQARRSIRALLRCFRRNEKGVAAVEFALILPFLLLLYMGSIEASSLFTVDRRVEVIATTMADLVARWNPKESTLPKDTLRDYFRAAEGIIVPYSTTGLTQVVSFLTVAANGNATVEWSCGWNWGTARTDDSSYTLSEDMKRLVTNGGKQSGYVVASETLYPYQPLLGIVFTSAINLNSEALFLPRFLLSIDKPSGGCPTV